jgi:ATP-dependent RNA helicase DDX27
MGLLKPLLRAISEAGFS